MPPRSPHRGDGWRLPAVETSQTFFSRWLGNKPVHLPLFVFSLFMSLCPALCRRPRPGSAKQPRRRIRGGGAGLDLSGLAPPPGPPCCRPRRASAEQAQRSTSSPVFYYALFGGFFWASNKDESQRPMGLFADARSLPPQDRATARHGCLNRFELRDRVLLAVAH